MGDGERDRRRKREKSEGSGSALVVVEFVRGGEGRGKVEAVVVRE